MEQVINTMKVKGAIIIRFSLPLYDTLAPAIATSQWEARTVMEKYFEKLFTTTAEGEKAAAVAMGLS